ncbi:hypothetical protein F53441_7225, partial [Fusarium austroafricanum]
MPLDAQKVRSIIDNACADQNTGIPGTTVVLVDKNGETFAHSAGTRGLGTNEPMTLDNVFWIASCTKMLAGVAVMQLVEQGKLNLDDGQQLETLVPELKKLKVLKADGSLEDKKNAITLRMLLTHTAGFGYTFFNERLRNWSHPAGIDEFSGRIEDIISMPLLFQPGEGWEYGVGIDWAGIALERVSGLKLNDYLQKNVFQPMGIKNMTMFPGKDMRSKIAHMHQRESDGKLRVRDHLQRMPQIIDPDNASEAASVFHSGGAGMFAQPQEYGKVISMLLNGGTCPKTGAQILKKETVDLMFTNSIEKFPNFSRQAIPAAKPDLTNQIPELYPVSGNPPQGWGLTFMLTNGGFSGRSKRTGHWAGLANLWWWADPDHGVGGIVCSQILPFADAKVLGLWAEVETEVYKSLKSKRGCDAKPLDLPKNLDPIRDGKMVVGEKPPLAQSTPCGYCTKTNKKCTMNWAWTQIQISAALAAAARGDPAIEIVPQRRESTSTDKTSESRTTSVVPDDGSFDAESTAPSFTQSLPPVPVFSDLDPGLEVPPFMDNSLDALPFDFVPENNQPMDSNFYGIAFKEFTAPEDCPTEPWDFCKDATVPPELQFDASSLSQFPIVSPAEPAQSLISPSYTNNEKDWNSRTKRRRVSTAWSDTQSSSLSSFSMDQSMMTKSNNQLISSGLLQIYHDVLEHNLSCWLNEVTCPFGRQKTLTQPGNLAEWGSNWTNRVLRRTLNLDRVAQSTQLIHMTRQEDSAVTKALHLSIMAFATQWAQGSRRHRERYPSLAEITENNPLNEYMDDFKEEFDRHLQRNIWDQAKRALDEVADVESYRVVCAEMIFGLTQKPLGEDTPDLSNGCFDQGYDADEVADEIASIIDNDGPPIFMERAARKMHTLKFKYDAERRGISRASKKRANLLSAMSSEDRGTIGLLYWLTVMFDTVSSSMAERPLVVVDANSQHDDARGDTDWNVPLFIQDSLDKPRQVVHWPCSYEEAAEAVTRSAPVKVLMFRHVAYLQSILRQGASGEKVEEFIERSARVYRYWNMTQYVPSHYLSSPVSTNITSGTFFRELLQNYDCIPGRIQSWFICISAHWHLGVLLLADIISHIDTHNLGLSTPRQTRINSKWVMRIRERSAKELSDLARVTTPVTATPIVPNLSEFHHAINQCMILTEPWTVILI